MTTLIFLGFVLFFILIAIAYLAIDERKYAALPQPGAPLALPPTERHDLLALRDLAPSWSDSGPSALAGDLALLQRDARMILIALVESSPLPILPYLQHAPTFAQGKLAGLDATLNTWRLAHTSSALVVELIAALPWDNADSLRLEAPPVDDLDHRVLFGNATLDACAAIGGDSPAVLPLLSSALRTLLLSHSIPPDHASIRQRVLTLRWRVDDTAHAQRLSRQLHELLGAWRDLPSHPPSASQLLHALLANKPQPHPVLLGALAPSGALHHLLPDILANPALADAELRPLAFMFATTFPERAPDALYSIELLEYALTSEHTSHAHLDLLLARLTAHQPGERWRARLLTMLAGCAVGPLCWAAAQLHAQPQTTTHERLTLLTLLAPASVDPQHGASICALMRALRQASGALPADRPLQIFTARLRAHAPERDEEPWAKIMTGAAMNRSALLAATTLTALDHRDADAPLAPFITALDAIQDPELHLAQLRHLEALCPDDPACDDLLFDAAYRRPDTAHHLFALALTQRRPEATHHIDGLLEIVSSAADQARALAVKIVLPRMRGPQRAEYLRQWSTQGPPELRLAAINESDGADALDAFTRCLSQSACPHHVIAQSLDWLDRFVASQPAPWPTLLTRFADLPRFERMTTLSLVLARGHSPPLDLIAPLITLPQEARVDTSPSEAQLWRGLGPWLMALPPGPHAEQLWRHALHAAPLQDAIAIINLLRDHGTGPSIGALHPLLDHPTLGVYALPATQAIERRLGANLIGSLEHVEASDHHGALSLSDPTQGQLSILPDDTR